jgi:uncharacterized membrane protein YkoI
MLIAVYPAFRKPGVNVSLTGRALPHLGEITMKNCWAALAAGLLLLAGNTSAQERKIKRSDLPPAVEKTVAAQSAGATIRGFSTEKENGQTLYEAEMTVNGHSKSVSMSADGSIVEVEEQVALDSLSPEVKAGFKAKAGKGKILKVESLRKRDELVAYEAKVDTNGKKTEIQIGPHGKPLDHKE